MTSILGNIVYMISILGNIVYMTSILGNIVYMTSILGNIVYMTSILGNIVYMTSILGNIVYMISILGNIVYMMSILGNIVKFQQDLYNNEMTYDEYEESFTTFKYQHKGYIAMVQMTIVAKGKCLFQIGWGHCINFTAYLFKRFNIKNSLCIEKPIIL